MELSKTIEPIQWCETSRNSLSLPENMPFDQWVAVGEAIKTVGESCLWWLGDWLLSGVKKFGDKAELAATEGQRLGFSKSVCSGAITVSEHVLKSTRVDSLSWSHHREVASMEEGDQIEWLFFAVEGGLTVSELRMAIRQDRKLLDDGSEDGEAVTYSPALWMDAMRPLKQMENAKPIDQWSEAQRASVMRMVWPAVEFYNRLADVGQSPSPTTKAIII